jgi:hypothetical protein
MAQSYWPLIVCIPGVVYPPSPLQASIQAELEAEKEALKERSQARREAALARRAEREARIQVGGHHY